MHLNPNAKNLQFEFRGSIPIFFTSQVTSFNEVGFTHEGAYHRRNFFQPKPQKLTGQTIMVSGF